MCIFSGEVESVGGTRIYCTELDTGVHATVYRMEIAASRPVAMILPVPVKDVAGDDDLTFIDLSGAPDFFARLDRLFPEPPVGRGLRSLGLDTAMMSPLPVHDVGDFIASFVPSLIDFDRLDQRFRLDSSVWASLPDYKDFGFAVFQLRSTRGASKPVHPMAYLYTAAHPDELFYPTVHVHDGFHADRTACFDHTLYLQGGFTFPRIERGGWEEAEDIPRTRDFEGTNGLVLGGRPVFRRPMAGMFDNADQVLLRTVREVEHVERGLRVA